MAVYLYERKRRIELTLRESTGVRTWNLPMNSNDFRVFKDVQNDVEFIVRNTDRKPINMLGRTAKINIFDQRTLNLLHQQDLTVVNESKGICKLVLMPDTTQDWLLQTYSYSVQITNLDGSTHLLYTDMAEKQSGFFELTQGPIFQPRPSYELAYDDLTTSQISINDVNTSIRLSSALPGAAQRNNTTGVHTLVAFLENFTGELLIQASLEQATPTEHSWFEIERVEYNHETSSPSFTFEGNFVWVRVRVINSFEQQPGDPIFTADEGTIRKLVFRN